jgi:hypothetical protein
MQWINLNGARTSCNCFTADAINLGIIRATEGSIQVYPCLRGSCLTEQCSVTQNTCIKGFVPYTLSVGNGYQFLC